MTVFGVAKRLLDESFEFPPEIEPEATGYYTKVMEHSATEFYPGDDFTLYEPRGHYAGDDDLERYFRALKWLSRRIYRIEDKSYPEESDVELGAAAYLAVAEEQGEKGAKRSMHFAVEAEKIHAAMYADAKKAAEAAKAAYRGDAGIG